MMQTIEQFWVDVKEEGKKYQQQQDTYDWKFAYETAECEDFLTVFFTNKFFATRYLFDKQSGFVTRNHINVTDMERLVGMAKNLH